MNELKNSPTLGTNEGLTWLILPDESTAFYTNFGDGRERDASSLVLKVNADPALNLGHMDWRLPTLDELQSLVCSHLDPKTLACWSSTSFEGDDRDEFGNDYAMYVSFRTGNVEDCPRSGYGHVRLVRVSQ